MAVGINYSEYQRDPGLLDRGAELRLDEGEAKTLFGQNFTGVVKDPTSGLFTPDSSAVQRLRNPFQEIQSGISNINNAGVASSSLANDLSEIQKRTQATRTATRDIFSLEAGNVERRGESRLGGRVQQGAIQGGTGSGLGMSTVRGAVIALEKEATSRSLKELKAAEAKALADLDMGELDKVRQRQKDEQDHFFKIRDMERQDRMALLDEKKFDQDIKDSDRTFDINTINALNDISEGQTVTIDGKAYKGLKLDEIDPFYKGSDVISLIKDLPLGEKFTLTDPSSGTVHTIEGIQTEDPSTQTFESTNNATGEVTLTTIDKNTGEILKAVSAGRTGNRNIGSTSGVKFDEKGSSAKISKLFESMKGDDGHVSPDDYTAARNAWISDGGKATTFDQNFVRYVNTAQRNVFGLEGGVTAGGSLDAIVDQQIKAGLENL